MTIDPVAAAPSAGALRDVLGAFTTGVVVITTLGDEGRPVGLTANSFNSVSIDPPLVLWSLALGSPSLAAFRTHDYFAVNILAEHQEHLSRRFANPAPNKFRDVAFAAGATGVPVLLGTAGHLECRTFARYPGGDHEIYLGEVISLQDRGHPPLVFHRGAFRRLTSAATQGC
jgi:flavin reductase (DIM6/NTAB) family NADH-FMN oxidoreductase RutF